MRDLASGERNRVESEKSAQVVTSSLSQAEAGDGSLTQAEATALVARIDGKAPSKPVRVEELCVLWAGMGHVYLVASRIIVKRIHFPALRAGKERSLGDQRKVDSYAVEAAFYERHAARLLDAPAPCALELPRPLLITSNTSGLTISMTRLKGTRSTGELSSGEAQAGIRWLARFHAAFWGEAEADGLQAQGTYWHLDTRPDEHRSMPTTDWEGRLRLAARAIDLRLKADPLQTVVHGDCKSDNMLFAVDADGRLPVRAQLYDFQYCGRASASKDLAYFLVCAASAVGSAEEECLLRHYADELSIALRSRDTLPPTLDSVREFLQLAYADLARFMSGWGWWGSASGLKSKARALLTRLDGGSALPSEQAYIDAIFRILPVTTPTSDALFTAQPKPSQDATVRS